MIFPEYNINLFILHKFWLTLLLGSDFQSFICARAKPCGKLDVNIFGLEKFPYLGVIFFERYICEIKKNNF